MIESAKIDEVFNFFQLHQTVTLAKFLGGNSVVFHLQAPSKEEYGLKIYTGSNERSSQSLRHELEAFNLLSISNEIPIPTLESSWTEVPAILYKWVSGLKPDNNSRTRTFLSNKIRALNLLFYKKRSTLMAIDAVANSNDLLNQIEDRHNKLIQIKNLPYDFQKNFTNLYSKVMENLKPNLDLGINTLSLSDFGTHNLVEDKLGNITFIDFEFFGNDSTAKLLGDLYAHPQGIFDSKTLVMLNKEINGEMDREFMFNIFVPAIALKWAYIIARRTIDWNTKTFVGWNQKFENPISYLGYVEFLFNNTQNIWPKTYLEYKSMR